MRENRDKTKINYYQLLTSDPTNLLLLLTTAIESNVPTLACQLLHRGYDVTSCLVSCSFGRKVVSIKKTVYIQSGLHPQGDSIWGEVSIQRGKWSSSDI